jgi:FAD/FMN-containing dehydrogenase
VQADLVSLVGAENVERDVALFDASGLTGRVDALVAPADAREVAAVVAWCYAHDVAMIPVGGRSGYSGGIVPTGTDADAGAVAIALHRLDAIRSFDPLRWRMEAEAGVTTATVARRARESGLLFPPDPGAAEQSQLGGNLATNAGGPHAFKYGVTGRWVTGVEAVIAPGELVSFGGPVRKDVAGLDLRALLIGSEGTLGIITAAWLRLVPAPAEAFPVAAAFGSVREGCAAIDAVLGSGVVPAAVEYLDGRCIAAAPPPFLDASGAALLVVCEAESAADRDELLTALGAGATASRSPSARPAARSCRKTSRCRSSASPRRSRARSRSARATGWRAARGATRATATCTPRSCWTRATRRCVCAPTPPPATSSTWPARSAGRPAASTASAS